MATYQIGNATYESDQPLNVDELNQLADGSPQQAGQQQAMQQPQSQPSEGGEGMNLFPNVPSAQAIETQSSGEGIPGPASQSPDLLNLQDHATLSFLDKPQDQQNYLQKKFPFVIPDGQGNFMVGNSARILTPINPRASGNTFFSWLASQSAQISSMIGMGIGAAAGVPGAAAGAAAGEAISKDIGAMLGSTESPLKMGVDTALSGAFGAIGQKAAQMFGIATNKVIAPTLAKAIDGKITSIVNSGKDPSKFINFVATAAHFASGVNKNDIITLMNNGVARTLSDPAVNNRNAIISIAQDLMKKTMAQQKALGIGVRDAEDNLYAKAAGRNVVQTSPIFKDLISEITRNEKLGTLSSDKSILTIKPNVVDKADNGHLANLLQDLGATPIPYKRPLDSALMRQARGVGERLGYDINNPAEQAQMEKMMPGQFPKGTIQDELDAIQDAQQNKNFLSFKLPTDGSKISVGQALRIRQQYGRLIEPASPINPASTQLSPNMRRIFGGVLSDNESGSGIRSQLSKVASANGVDDYVASNVAYYSLMDSIRQAQGVGLDPFNPKSIGDFVSHINKANPIEQQALDNFESNIGTSPLGNLKKYAAIEHLNNFNPNFLRLGLIASFLGGTIGGGDLSQRAVRAISFGAGTPFGLSASLKGAETVGNVGRGVLKALSSKASTAIGSQEAAGLLGRLINPTTRPSQGKRQ